MNNKCVGCGSYMQSEDPNKEGYAKKSDSVLCERCFRIKHYGDYKLVIKNNNDFLDILNDINLTKDLVVLVVDIFNINEELINLSDILNNKILLVLSKRDVMPKSIWEEKIVKYMDRFNLNIIDSIIISSKKNYNFDELYEKINKYKVSKNVYVVGFTNSGKSTMINKLIYNYSDDNTEITTSILPSTTLNSIEINLNDDLVLIDTPGLLDSGNIINYVSEEDLKRIVPTREIKPVTFQIKKSQYIKLDNYAYIECLDKTNITLFMSNKLNLTRIYDDVITDKLYLHEVEASDNEDIVILGLGFIKVSKKCKFKIYTLKNVLVYKRDSLI